MKLKLIAEKLNLDVTGNLDIEIEGICSVDEPVKNGISFLKTKSNTNPLATTEISVLVSKEAVTIPENKALIISADPFSTFVKIIEIYKAKEPKKVGISERAFISESSKIGKNCNIYPGVTVMDNVEIGDNTTLYPNVVVYQDCKIGSNTVIHSGVTIREETEIGNHVIIFSNSTIGTDGFGYIPDQKEILKMVPQIGKVIIKDHVHIGSNSCIDRATFGTTVIGHGSKIDNHVQIGHNVKIGKYTLVCGSSGIAGSSTVGDFCILGGRTSVSDHIHICDKVRIGGHSLVIGNIDVPGDYVGTPAVIAKDGKRNLATLRDIAKTITELKKK